MLRRQLVYITGDMHGDWVRVNQFFNTCIKQVWGGKEQTRASDQLEIVILQAGDFGYWPHQEYWQDDCVENAMPGILDGRIKLYWCDGNHENHDKLDELQQASHAQNPEARFIETMPGVYFAPFGSVLRLLDGTTVLFCGGAESTDKAWRIPGETWWAQETIDEKDMAQLPPPESLTVDWVISHTCPAYFQVQTHRGNCAKETDPSKILLNRVFDMYRPKRWWFGHYHDYQQGEYKGCSWTMLDRIGNPDGDIWVEEVARNYKNWG